MPDEAGPAQGLAELLNTVAALAAELAQVRAVAEEAIRRTELLGKMAARDTTRSHNSIRVGR